MFRKWMKTRRLEDRHEYIAARNEAERVKRREKREEWRRIGRDLEKDYTCTRKLLFSIAKNYRNSNTGTACPIREVENNIITEPEKVINRWREYFEELLNVIEAENVQYESDIDIDVGEEYEEISVEEVKKALKQMKRGKATGDDGMPVEIRQGEG